MSKWISTKDRLPESGSECEFTLFHSPVVLSGFFDDHNYFNPEFGTFYDCKSNDFFLNQSGLVEQWRIATSKDNIL